MAKAAHSEELTAAVNQHLKETERQVSRLFQGDSDGEIAANHIAGLLSGVSWNSIRKIDIVDPRTLRE